MSGVAPKSRRGLRHRGMKIHFTNGATVDAEVPQGELEMTQGLRGRLSASPMLFIFPRDGQWPMTMTGLSFNLDFVFIDSAGTVVEIMHNVAKGVALVSPAVFARYVLELPSGWARGFRLVPGELAMMIPLIR